MSTFIIGLSGPMGVGKTTTANEIIKIALEHQARYPAVHKVAFADALKTCAIRWFGWNGQKDEKGRRMLQLLGTEVGRAYDENVWICHWRSAVDIIGSAHPRGAVIVADDVRFDNEASYIKGMGGFMARLVGRGGGDALAMKHSSEGGINGEYIDTVIDISHMTPAEVALRIWEQSKAGLRAVTSEEGKS